ncbi:small nuclear ribonucleoprotein E-like [Echinops telfairi]|uniref:Small nuclear ribonucleoprotein E n=1 Tax=Echinops telfairi TaxID=9371 RepID=A0ABM0ZSF7_ECHTE|nr:small nuclear ribonucleoprotein E-like [Echinops telfairi]
MVYCGRGQKVEKVMVQLVVSYAAKRKRSWIQVWLYEQVTMQREGCLLGFDECMDLVLGDAEEIHSKTKSRKQLGRIMRKGDHITRLLSLSN